MLPWPLSTGFNKDDLALMTHLSDTGKVKEIIAYYLHFIASCINN